MEIGTKEQVGLKPATVEIKDISVNIIGEKKLKKLSCQVKHPDKEEVVEISSVKYEKGEKLKTSGLWIHFEKDDKGNDTKKLQKGSALTLLMEFAKVKTPKELEGKKLETVEDDKGYLCFKAY